jgi:hypothetical protein
MIIWTERFKLKILRIILLSVTTFVTAVSLYGTNYYVKVNGSGTRVGNSWTDAMDNRAFTKKLLTAASGDVFYLAAGSYIPYFDASGNESGNKRAKTFLIRDGVSIQGGYDADGKPIAERDSAIVAVKFSGANDNVYHVVTVAGSANSVSLPMLSNLCIMKGYANGGGDNSRGAGIFVGTNAGANRAIKFFRIKVSDNHSSADGSGIFIDDNAAVVIDSSEISKNTRIASADVYGGGIGVIRARLEIRNSVISDNASNHGGAIHVTGGQLTSSNCVYSNNSAGTHGGALDTYDRSKTTSNSDVFLHNSALEGGGVHNESRSDIKFKKCVFVENKANEGGGFYNPGDCTAEIDSCTFEKNTAQRGGGIDNRGNMNIVYSRIIGNIADDGDASGGGINQRGKFTMKYSELSGNTAETGGGIYSENNFTIISNTTVSGNTATVDGGGIYHRYDKFELNFVTVTGNSASQGNPGGGILSFSRPLIRNSIISGNYDDKDISGSYLYETGDGNSTNNIIGSMYYAVGNRKGDDVGFDAKQHLGALSFNRGRNTRSHALIWTVSSKDNPAVGKAKFDANNRLDQTGVVRSERYPSLGAYEETLFKAFNDFVSTDGEPSASVKILNNDSYPTDCTPQVNLITQTSKKAMNIKYLYGDLLYTPNIGVNGFDTVKYSIQCGQYVDIAEVVIEIGRNYDRPANIRDEITCMEDMPAIKFKAHRKFLNEDVFLDGFSIPLVGDINGDGKPEIIGLGAVADGGGKMGGLDAVGRSIVIYDGQTGVTILNFDLNTLGGGNKYTDTYGYGTQFGFQLRWEPRHNCYSHLAIADLDNDNIGEIVVAETGSGKLYVLKPVLDINRHISTLKMFWEATTLIKSPYSSSYGDYSVYYFGSPVPYISDLNGDGIAEVIVYNKIYNGRTGALVLELETLNLFSDPGNNKSTYESVKNYAYVGRLPSAEPRDDCIPVMAINDIDNDGVMEIIAGSKIYKPQISNASSTLGNKFKVAYGPESVNVANEICYLTDGFTVVADIDGDNSTDVIVVKRHKDRSHFVIYVWDPRMSGNASLKAVLALEQSPHTGHFSVPFVGDVNGRKDGWDAKGNCILKLPEICMTIGELEKASGYSVEDHELSKIPEYTTSQYTGNDGTNQDFQGHVVAFTYDSRQEISKRLRLSWMMKHSDNSHQTGIVMFDFDADGIDELVYRDELSLRVISPANRADGYDFVNLKMDHHSHPNVIRFRETGIVSYTGFECPIIADVNGDGSTDIITFALKGTSRTGNSAGNLYVYEAAEGSWAPSRPVWNQGIYYPLQINDNLTVPRRPQSTLTKYYSKLPAHTSGDTIRPFNGNWIQQPIVRTNNYVPIMMTSDPSIAMEGIKIISSTNTLTKMRITVENRGGVSANTKTPITFYHTAIDPNNKIITLLLQKDIYPNSNAVMDYDLPGDFTGKVIYVRLVDDGSTMFPAKDFFDCDPTNNVAYTMQVTAVDDYFSLTSAGKTYLDISKNDIYNTNITPQIEIIESGRHGLPLVEGTQISYRANPGFQGVDTVRYRIRCTSNSITTSDEAIIYVFVLKMKSLEYVACPGANLTIELDPVANVTYDWYDSQNATSPLSGGQKTNSMNFVKGSKDETLWVQVNVKGFPDKMFPRLGINLPLATNCKSTAPSECMTNGTLLFHESFGGDSPSDDDIVKNGNLSQVQQYVYSTKYSDNNSYTIRKVSGGLSDWHNNIDDHTFSGDPSRGYMLQFRATKSPGQFYRCRLDDLCEGSKLDVSAWIASISKTNKTDKVNLTFVIEDVDGNVLSKYYTGSLTDNGLWGNYGFSFTVPDKIGSIILKIINNSSGSSYNVFVIDDIKIYLCTPKVVLNGERELCVGEGHLIEGIYPDTGNPLGNELEFRLEFRHIDSLNWKTLVADPLTNPPLNISMTFGSVAATDDGYYRLRISKSGNINSQNCCAVSDSIRVKVNKKTKASDIRIQLSPTPGHSINLSSFIDNVNYSGIQWSRASQHAPAFIGNTDKTTGSINSSDFKSISTYTYKYTATQCGSSEAKVYIRTVKDKFFNVPDTITVCGTHESSRALNLNSILGLEFGGQWLYDNTVNPDNTVSNNVTVITAPSQYVGAQMFNAVKAWETAPISYSIKYRNYNRAKIFKFIYTPGAGSSITTKKELVIIVAEF